MRKLILLVSILAISLAGCGQSGSALPSAAQPPGAATATVTPVPGDPIQAPSATPVPPSAVPSPSPTFTPTPTPHTMDVAAARRGDYPGSDITLEQELARGSNYRRFYASYRSQGLKIYALLTLPDGQPPAGGWPAIVFNHGYIPPEVYRTTERYVAYVDLLARSGYIVFRIDYRGNDRSEGAPTGAYGDPGYTADVLNAVASLRRFPEANPQKIGMWGHSMGGFLTLRAMVISPDIKAGVIWSGVVGSYADMICCWKHSGPAPTPPASARRWRSDWIRQYGPPEQNPAFWNSISANAFLGNLSGPLQLHASLTDPEVPPAFSEDLAKEIQAAGGAVELYTYEQDDHNLSKSFSLAMQRTLAFFDQHLK